MPPGAEFEAVLQDVSRADAPAMEIARATIPNAPNPPIRFTIPFDVAKIHAGHSYSVRAVIRAEGQLLFSSDTVYPVLTHGAGHSVDILLKRAAARAHRRFVADEYAVENPLDRRRAAAGGRGKEVSRG